MMKSDSVRMPNVAAAVFAVCSLVACGNTPIGGVPDDSAKDSGLTDGGQAPGSDAGDASLLDSGADAGGETGAVDSGGDTAPALDAGADAARDATVQDSAYDSSADGGADADAAETGPTCINLCNLGAAACTGGSPQTCQTADSGCTVWATISTCGSHQACQTDGGSAGCGCVPSPLCAEAGPVCDTNLNQLDVCNLDTDGCLYVNPGSICVTDAGHSSATCAASECVVGCVTGFHSCNGVCSDNTSVSSCGGSCAPCAYPANAVATCDGGSCGYACNWGWGKDGGGCSPLPLPPRPTGPLSTKIVTTSMPTLSWQPVSGFTQFHVDVCADRACSAILWSSDVSGLTTTVGHSLPRGAAFWRVFGLVEGQRTLPSVTWQLQVPGVNVSARSSSWGTMHDFNGDGISDLLGPTSAGATVYFGGDAGITDATVTANFAGPDVYMAASAGDVNGDGFGDLVVADFSGPDQVHVYFGGPTGFPATPTQNLPVATQVVPVGDLNGDGYADLAVSGATQGTIDVYFGSPTGLLPTASVTLSPAPPGCGNMGSGSTASFPQQLFGGGGDVNGDGYDDLVAGDGTCDGGVGQLYVFFGSDAGPPSLPSQTVFPPTNAVTEFGAIAIIAGDLNGDGYSDVVLGSPPGAGTAADESRIVSIFLGSGTGLPAAPSMTLPSPTGASQFSTAVAAAGDVNGDGFSDLLVGDPQYFDVNNPESQYGAAFLYLGGSTGPHATPSGMLPTPPPLNLSADSARPVAGVGDVNGDGLFDVISSCWGPTAPGCAATLYLGSDAGVNPAPAAALPVKMNVLNGATWWSSL